MTRDINLLEKIRLYRFAEVTSRFDQQYLCQAVQSLTRQALQDGFDVEDIKAVLGFMMETEIDVTVDCFESE